MRALVCLYFLLQIAAHGAELRLVEPPVGAGSGMAFLTVDAAGKAYLSWTDPLPQGGHALRYARWTGKAWGAPATIARGPNWFVNWADFPALAALPDGSMLAHWLTKTEGSGTYGYGIRVARKAPGGSAWREVFGANLTDKEDYAGFLSFVTVGKKAGAVYLAPAADERRSAPAHDHEQHQGEEVHRKTLRYVSFGPGGNVTSDLELDGDTCSCCQTTVVATAKGLVAAYRDHEPGEIRDISVVRLVNGTWTAPEPLHRDGWKINGCPTEGPSAEVIGDHVGIAWLTRAKDRQGIWMSLSANGGARFGEPIRMDDGNPYGHPSVTRFDATHFLVAWLEKTAQSAEVRVRRVSLDGAKSPSVSIASVAAARSTGLPKAVVVGDQILFAWRDERVRTGVLTKSRLLSLEHQ